MMTLKEAMSGSQLGTKTLARPDFPGSEIEERSADFTLAVALMHECLPHRKRMKQFCLHPLFPVDRILAPSHPSSPLFSILI
jgi:hypothetical protein